jgi:hypothetical protein
MKHEALTMFKANGRRTSSFAKQAVNCFRLVLAAEYTWRIDLNQVTGFNCLVGEAIYRSSKSGSARKN